MSFRRLRGVSCLLACVTAVGVASLLWAPAQADPSFGVPSASATSSSSDVSASSQSTSAGDSSSLSQPDSATSSPSATLLKDPLALSDRDQTYSLNPVTVTTTTQYLTDASAAWSGGAIGDGSHCAQVERVELAGLVDQTIQQSVADKVTAIQDDYLKALWRTDHVVTLSTCARGADADDWESDPGFVRLGAGVTANFANVLSVAQTWSQPGLMSGGSLPGVNVRLDTGADLGFTQLFSHNADITSMVREQILAAYPRTIDAAALSRWLDGFAANMDQPFSFSGTTVSVSLPDDASLLSRSTPTGGTPSAQTSQAGQATPAASIQPDVPDALMNRRDIAIPFEQYWSQVAVFNLAAQVSDLYVEAAEQPTCPVLTDYRVDYPTDDQPWSAAYCWAGATEAFDEVEVEAAGGPVSVVLGFNQSEQWRIVDGGDRLSLTSVGMGTGPTVLTAVMAANQSADPVADSLRFQVVDPTTSMARQALVTIVQAGVANLPAPTITTANAALVAGRLALSETASDTITVIWPDGSTSDPLPVGDDGTWSASVPADMESGTVTVRVTGGSSSIRATATLDADPPTTPQIDQANAEWVRGSLPGRLDPSTTVTVTDATGGSLCDVTLDEALDEGDVSWACRIPATFTSDTEIVVVATDPAGNMSEAAMATLDVTAPAAPTVTAFDHEQVAGTLLTPVDADTTVTVMWPDAATTNAAVREDGTWSLPVPSDLVDDAVITVAAIDAAGNRSAATSVGLAGSTDPDVSLSTLTLTGGPVTVDVPPCGGEPTASIDVLTATVQLVDGTGRPLPGVSVGFTASGGLMQAQDYAIADAAGVATAQVLVDPVALAAGEQPFVEASIVVDGVVLPVAGSPASPNLVVNAPPADITTPQLIGDAVATVYADGASHHTVAVSWIDGCSLPMAGAEIALTHDGSATLSADSVVLDARGVADVQVSDAVAETVHFGAHVTGFNDDAVAGSASAVIGAQGQGVAAVFAPAIPDPIQSTLVASPTLVPVACDQTGSTTLTAVAKDSSGHPLYGVAVMFAADGGATLTQETVTTDSTGAATTTLTASSGVTSIVTARLADVAGNPPVDLTQPPLLVAFDQQCERPTSPSSIWYGLSDGPKLADGQAAYTLTIYARDINGGAISGLTDRFTITPDPALTVGALTEAEAGTYTASVTSTTPGTFPLFVAMTMDDGSVRQVAGAVDGARFTSAWIPMMATELTATGGPLAAALPHLANGIDEQVVTVRLSSRLNGASPAPLTGQAAQLSVGPTTDSTAAPGESAMDASASATTTDLTAWPVGVVVSGFVEVTPGVYQARITATQSAAVRLHVTWTGTAAETMTSRELVACFIG